jgi:hypothetical protein
VYAANADLVIHPAVPMPHVTKGAILSLKRDNTKQAKFSRISSLGLQFALIRARGRAHRTADHKINLTMTASCQIIDALLDGKNVLAGRISNLPVLAISNKGPQQRVQRPDRLEPTSDQPPAWRRATFRGSAWFLRLISRTFRSFSLPS